MTLKHLGHLVLYTIDTGLKSLMKISWVKLVLRIFQIFRKQI